MITLQSPEWNGLNLYNLFWTLSWLLGLFIFVSQRFQKNRPPIETFCLGLGIFFFSIVGGRLFFFITHPRKTFLNALSFENGGLVLWGSLLGGLAFVALAKKMSVPLKKEPKLSLLNDFAVALPGAIALGRLGCFFQGCCHGKLMSSSIWSVTYTSSLHSAEILRAPLYPVQIIESFGLLLILLCQISLKKKLPPLFSFLIFYSLLRFFTEFLRGDEIRGSWGFLSPSQSLSLGILLVSLWTLFFRAKRVKNP